MSRTIVFLGPTLSVADARRELDAVYLPPVSQGDVYKAARQRPRAIAIIDGYFERMPAVWHKEVLWAMSQGIHVFGASSMGALRAAELEPFGMVGVGEVFEAFLAGTLTDDDEVAVAHGPAENGYRLLSEAMVNIRATLAAARDQGVVSSEVHDRLIGLAKDLFYPERSYPRLLQLAAEDPGTAAACQPLKRWLATGQVDQKRLDALALLRHLRAWLETDPSSKEVRYPFHHTTFWEELRLQHLDASLDAEPGVETRLPDAVSEELRLRGEPYLRDVESAFSRFLAGELAARLGLKVGRAEVAAAEEALRHRHGLEAEEALQAWLQEQQVGSREELAQLLERDLLASRLRVFGTRVMDLHLRDGLRLQGRYSELVVRSRDKQRSLARRGLDNPGLADTGLADEAALWRWYFQDVLGRPVPNDLTEHAHRFDFPDLHTFRRAVLREYCYRRMTPPG